MGTPVPTEPRWSSDASPAEKQLWRWAVEQLPDRVLVLPQVAMRLAEKGKTTEAEIDLVLLDPEAGVTLVEVKGGSMGYSSSGARWLQNGKECRDPVQQIQRGRGVFRDVLDAAGFDRRTLPIRWAVAVPECRMDAPGGSVLDEDLLWDDRACDDLATMYHRVACQLGTGEQPLGQARVDFLRRHLRGRDQEGRPSLRAAVDEHERLVQVHTESHRNVLAAFSMNDHVLVRGSAGTGKTELAIQVAAVRAAWGDRVLLTCWNVVLGSWLRVALTERLRSMGSPLADEVTDDPAGRIVVCDIADLAERAVGELPTGMDKSELYHEWLPDRFADLGAAATGGEYFDLVVLDEAQDLTEAWELAVAAMVAKDGRWFAFSDRRQDLFATGSSLPDFLEVEHELQENFRNSPEIAAFASRFGDIEMDCATESGLPIRYARVDDPERVIGRAQEVGKKLSKQEGIPDEDLAVLFLFHNPSKDRSDDLAAAALRGERICTNAAVFKGMERPVVVLGVDLDPSKRDRPGDVAKQIYVAATRARSHLVVVGNPDACDAYGFGWLADQLRAAD